MPVPYHTHEFEVETATAQEILDGIVADKVITPNQLAAAYPELAQGVEEDDLAAVATSGEYSDLLNPPAFGALALKSQVDVPADINATGTPSGSTFLRGDGAWSVPPGGGLGGDVDSVNGQTGEVVLDTDDISDSGATNKYTTAGDITKLGYLTVTQAVDLDAIEAKLADVEDEADVTDAANVGSSIHGAAEKTTPVDDDEFPIIDSAASNVLKWVKWESIKASFFGVLNSLAYGFTSEAVNDGTKSTGTYTPTPSGGNFKRAINNGAFTLAAPTETGDYTLVIQFTNGASAGVITDSGFSKEDNASVLTTTNGHDFLAYITKVNGFTHLQWVALQ